VEEEAYEEIEEEAQKTEIQVDLFRGDLWWMFVMCRRFEMMLMAVRGPL
jgi:fructosamine-3-kinase